MIKIEDISKKYKSQYALDHVSCVLEKETYALLGPNGAGKTTLFRILTGQLQANEGSIEQAVSGNRIGYLPQKFGAFPNFKVWEQMEFFAALKGLKRKDYDWKKEIEEILETVNLTEQKNKKCGKLSGGMLRRLGIAQALLGSPELILLDEPTAGLDIEECMNLKKILQEISGGQTIIISTHIVSDVESLADKILILNKGKLLAQLTQEELCSLSEEGNSLEKGYLRVIHGEV